MRSHAALPDAHGIDLSIVLDTVRELGGTLPRIVVVGCEPETIEPGMELSPRVEAAVPGAIELIRELISNEPQRSP